MPTMLSSIIVIRCVDCTAVQRLGFCDSAVFGAMLAVEIRKRRAWFGRGLNGLFAIASKSYAKYVDYVGTYDACTSKVHAK